MRTRLHWLAFAGLAAALALPSPAFAAPPVVKTVPWVATNPLIPHDTWSGKSIRLKGTSDVSGANIHWIWDFGDGSPVATGTVTAPYAIEAAHTYTGAAGTVFTARLTVQNITSGETGDQAYYVEIRDKTLEVEANVAIDEGLWYLHKTQTRSTSAGQPIGYWNSGSAGSSWHSVSGANVNAFLVNGHLATGASSNPYTETASRGVNYLFTTLGTTAIPASQTNPAGTFNPDANGNGYGVYVAQSSNHVIYQGGPITDAIVATGTPNAIAVTGQAPSGSNPGILGRTYKDIVQDMQDYFSYCQYDSGSGAGGWRYSCNQFPDNSAAQWAAIGTLAAVRQWGVVVPDPVTACNLGYWLPYSQFVSAPYLGAFGYTGKDWAWGLQATTPSGMVQLAMDGAGRSNPLWDNAETYVRNNFCNTGGASVAVRDYYYGLFALVKAMLLHDSNDDAVAEPLVELGKVSPIDWYHAEAAKGDQCDGVARTLINDQNSAGYWSGHNYWGDQYPFETAWAIMMLAKTLFESGKPVAVIKANPNPAVAGQIVQLDGASSFHQDAAKSIDSWTWDLDNDGECNDASGPFATVSFPLVNNYPVKLCVADNGTPELSASATLTIVVSTPPVAPTAKAGGPYSFCPVAQPWYLNGTGSTNPDEGQSEAGKPGNTIIAFEWDLDGDGQYDDAFGAQPDVTAFFTGKGPGSYLTQLKVTDNTAASFPSSGMPNLSDTDTAVVVVRASTDSACVCISNLTARAKPGKADLVWTNIPGTHHYNVYRGTIFGGPYLKIAATTSTYSTYADMGLVNGTTYYWVVRPATVIDVEVCQSNQASATPKTR